MTRGTVNCYLFDVDETLELSRGPVTLSSIAHLRDQGHIVGLCGNFAMVTHQLQDWHHLFSLVSVAAPSKEEFMIQVKRWIPADNYIMVGNGSGHNPNDQNAAWAAGWRFIAERDFAAGER